MRESGARCGWQRAANDPRVRIDTSDGWYSESHRGIRALARVVRDLPPDVTFRFIGDGDLREWLENELDATAPAPEREGEVPA